MKRTTISIVAAILLMLPVASVAQKDGGKQMKHKAKGSMMQANMGAMADMMTKMSKLMTEGKLKPEEQKKCAEIMKRMSQVMQEMSVPHDKQVQAKHQKELREIESEINPLFDHLVQPG